MKVISSEKRTVLKNIFALFTLQGANYLLPLLTFPYLVRVLGIEKFGLLAFATAITAYFLVITDYGFNLSATNKIAVNKKNISKVNDIFLSVILIKFVLVVICFFLMIGVVSLIPKYSNHLDIFIYTYGMVVGQALIPLWLFQGLETMKYMTYFNVFAKLLSTVSIFMFVKQADDYYLVPILTSIGFIVSGLLSLFWALKQFKLKVYRITIIQLKTEIIDGWHVFINNVVVNLYSTTNTVVLGIFTNNTIVGYYAIAEKIIGAFSGLFAPVTQAIYPYMSSLFVSNTKKFESTFKSVVLLYIVVAFIISAILYLYSDFVIKLINGKSNEHIFEILNILVFALALSPLGRLFTQTFIVKSQTKKFMKVVKYTLYTNIILLFPLVYYFGAVGLAVTVVIRQIAHTLLNFKYYFEK